MLKTGEGIDCTIYGARARARLGSDHVRAEFKVSLIKAHYTRMKRSEYNKAKGAWLQGE